MGNVKEIHMSPLPQNNPFFNLTPELKTKALKGLEGELNHKFYLLRIGGNWKLNTVISTLKDIQNILDRLQEFGFEVNLLDEEQFPQIAEAIVALKRGNLEGEISEVMMRVMEPTNIAVLMKIEKE